ncbi:hypothetical protein ES703_103664 [subsurface metagenome]
MDGLKFEFVEDQIIPEFVNIQENDILSGGAEIIVRASGDDYDFCELWFDYKHMGGIGESDFLIGNLTQFEFKDDNYSYFNFSFDTTDKINDYIYKFIVIMQDNKGFRGEATLSNIAIINGGTNITCIVEQLGVDGWKHVSNYQEVSGYIKLNTINSEPKIKLIQVSYYFYDEMPSEQNKDNWVKFADVANEEQDFSYTIHADSIPNGTWYVISEAFNGGTYSNYSVFENLMVFDHFKDSIHVHEVVSCQDTVFLEVSSLIESKIEYVEFWANSTGLVLLATDTSSPFSATFVNLPWLGETEFDIFIQLKILYTYFGTCYLNLTKTNILLDSKGPALGIGTNPNDILYQIQQAGGNWIASSEFDGIINGTIQCNDMDFTGYRIAYKILNVWKVDSRFYAKNEPLQWNIKYFCDAENIEFKIIGYDKYGNSNPSLSFSFKNDQNRLGALKIEGYSIDRIYHIWDPVLFKITPSAQDIYLMEMVYAGRTYPFTKEKNNFTGEIYFTEEIRFDPLDFDLSTQSIDTQILTIRAYDSAGYMIEKLIPFTVGIAYNTEISINNLDILTYKHLRTLASSKKPQNSHLLIETSNGTLYFITPAKDRSSGI